MFLRYGQFSIKFPTPKYENVPLAPDSWNFAYLSLTNMANYSRKKFSPMT